MDTLRQKPNSSGRKSYRLAAMGIIKQRILTQQTLRSHLSNACLQLPYLRSATIGQVLETSLTQV